jgi:uncharacterized protein (DUF433 family)
VIRQRAGPQRHVEHESLTFTAVSHDCLTSLPLLHSRSKVEHYVLEKAMRFERITVDPRQMNGVACIRGLRIPVATVVGMVADGMTEPEILAAYPDLEREDIHEALQYAAEVLRERELPLVIP